MTDTLTKDDIETMRPRLLVALSYWQGSGPALNTLCDLALEALAIRPRPISELPKESCRVLIWPIKVGKWVYGGHFNEYYFDGGWKHSEISHFIPLSSLPKVTP